MPIVLDPYRPGERVRVAWDTATSVDTVGRVTPKLRQRAAERDAFWRRFGVEPPALIPLRGDYFGASTQLVEAWRVSPSTPAEPRP